MNRLYGVVGVAGIGKTTLCRESGHEFIKTDVSGIYKKHGLDPKVKMGLDTRLMIQREILDFHLKQWLEACVKGRQTDTHMLGTDRVLVTDRTPLCFMTFTLAEISGYGELTPEQNLYVQMYLNKCWKAMSLFKGVMHLKNVFETRPDDSGKVRASTGYAYSAHYDYLLRGLLSELPLSRVAFCETGDRDARQEQLGNLILHSW